MKNLFYLLIFFAASISTNSQELIRFFTTADKALFEYGEDNFGNKFFPIFDKTSKKELDSFNKKYSYKQYESYTKFGIGQFYFDDSNKLSRFEFQNNFNENTKFYLDDILLIDRNLLMKIYDEMLQLGFEYYGKPQFEKNEIDINSYYKLSNGILNLIIFPHGRTNFPNSKGFPYVIIEKL